MFPRELLNQSVSGGAAAANGTSTEFNCQFHKILAVDINVTTLSGGTAPTLTFHYERKGADGTWYRVTDITAALAATGAVSRSIGETLTTGANAYGIALGSQVRLAWTAGGIHGTTAFTLSVIGK